MTGFTNLTCDEYVSILCASICCASWTLTASFISTAPQSTVKEPTNCACMSATGWRQNGDNGHLE
ncbi:MAG: hypothetical protein ACLR23_25975 [Clostridia bacterium]